MQPPIVLFLIGTVCQTAFTSTEEALDKIAKQRFDIIISDMGRPRDSKADYSLLDSLQVAGNRVPFVIYAGSNAPITRLMRNSTEP